MPSKCFLSLISTLILIIGILVVQPVFAGQKTMVTDLAGHRFTLDLPVKSMVLPGWSGSGNPFYTLFALMGDDATKMIIGMDDGLKRNRNWIWQQYLDRYPELADIPFVGSPPEINVEKIISLKPDVVMIPAATYASARAGFDMLAKAGIPVLQVDYHKETMETHIRTIKLIGDVVGRPERAKELIDFYKAQCAVVHDRLAASKISLPKIYVELGQNPKEYNSSYGKIMWGLLIPRAGGQNIAENVVERYAPVSPEFVLKTDPQVVIFTGANWSAKPDSLQLGYQADEAEAEKRLSRFLTRPGWEGISAVKNKRVFGIHHGLAREVWDFYPLQCFAKWLHPELFKDLDPLDGFKAFHERFLGVKYSGTWAVELD